MLIEIFLFNNQKSMRALPKLYSFALDTGYKSAILLSNGSDYAMHLLR
jgi:hypothetical protein